MSWSEALRAFNLANSLPLDDRVDSFALALGLHVPPKKPDDGMVLHEGVWVPKSAVESLIWRGLADSMMVPFTAPLYVGGFWGSSVLERVELEPEPDLPKESRTEAIIGWRAWNDRYVSSRLRLLGSVVKEHLWPPGEAMRAVGMPERDNEAGVYAYKTESAARKNSAPVVGTVALWGKVIECERGYRAEYAYPQRLFVRVSPADERKRIARILASTYGCEAE